MPTLTIFLFLHGCTGTQKFNTRRQPTAQCPPWLFLHVHAQIHKTWTRFLSPYSRADRRKYCTVLTSTQTSLQHLRAFSTYMQTTALCPTGFLHSLMHMRKYTNFCTFCFTCTTLSNSPALRFLNHVQLRFPFTCTTLYFFTCTALCPNPCWKRHSKRSWQPTLLLHTHHSGHVGQGQSLRKKWQQVHRPSLTLGTNALSCWMRMGSSNVTDTVAARTFLSAD